ncbi:sortase domain-containing protein [Streptomyces antarcticus]|uniref:sortase domain-containing protein n=1 Tax=Streptomyces antarcticus TaxID=2996458 RepID=UPI00226D84CC|nr:MULTISPECIES: sortase [unclassified Streptomyces]MCY0943073.1 sortase [Streptomyces sp. H34-AA3]MCZ4084434.1 sortase [Streptomyces sp. H34-S5]
MTRMPFLASRTMPAALAGAALAVLLAAPSAPAFPSGSASAPARAAALVQTASLSIPAIGVSGLPVIPYPGSPDDAPGTRIQDQGGAASPYGPGGGVGPGDVGNYIVTGHRITAGGPLRALPSLPTGASVFVTAGGVTYQYTITATRTTSFRSQASMAAQRAAVPGSPGAAPTRAMITVTTCLTPEDDAAGNFWRDAQNNPEHRLDKIGVLTATKP